MTILAVLFAVLGAFVGAGIWAAITYVTGYQIGFMAIGIGALVGAGTRYGDGEGKVAALFAGGLSLVAMFLGDVMSIHITLDRAIKDTAEIALSREMYNEEIAMADEFVLFTPEDQYKQFIFDNTYYSEAETPEEVTDEEVRFFLEESAPELRRLHQERPDFQTWKARGEAFARAQIMDGANITGFVFENIGIMGVVFWALGIFTAMRVVGEWE